MCEMSQAQDFARMRVHFRMELPFVDSPRKLVDSPRKQNDVLLHRQNKSKTGCHPNTQFWQAFI